MRVTPDAVVDGIAIQAAEAPPGTHRIQRIWTWRDEPVRPGEAMPSPSLTLDDDLGRALLDALADHYGHASGGRQQRADFEHERRRVDKLTDRMLELLGRAGGDDG